MGEALETVRGVYDAFIREDWEAFFALFHPDVELDLSRSGIPDAGSYRGHEGVRAGWIKWRGVWEQYEVEVEDVLESGERALGLTRVTARSKGHGVGTTVEGADLYTVRECLVVRLAIYLDRDAARADGGF